MSNAPSASACEPYRELIAEALARGRNAVAIWQDLVDDHGFTARYASVRGFVLTLRGGAPAEARVVITTSPGEDYGEFGEMLSRQVGLCGPPSILAPAALSTSHNSPCQAAFFLRLQEGFHVLCWRSSKSAQI